MKMIQKNNKLRRYSITIASLLMLSFANVNSISANTSLTDDSGKQVIQSMEILEGNSDNLDDLNNGIEIKNENIISDKNEQNLDDTINSEAESLDSDREIKDNDSEENINNDEKTEQKNIDIKGSYNPRDIRDASLLNVSRSSVHYTTEFIQTIAPLAMELGEEYGLYPSVIIAQAALESGWGGKSPDLSDDYVLSLPPNYNLFGVKGEYNGNSVAVKTKEFDKKLNDYIEIVDFFRKYPSYKESLLDYVNKMKYNTTTKDPYIYSGTWVVNAASAFDATSSLTGIYATDPEYHNKLNRIIKNYNLTQYDDMIYPKIEVEVLKEVVKDINSVVYRAEIKMNTIIYKDINHLTIVDNSNNLSNKNIIVRKEAVLDNQKWVNIEANGKLLGWVKEDSIVPKYMNIISQNKVAYRGRVLSNGQNFYSQPAWTKGNIFEGLSSKYSSALVTVIEEISTDNGTYLLVNLNGNILGWINSAGITPIYDDVLRNPVVAYNAEIVNSSQNIYSRPAWTLGNKFLASSKDYVGKKLKVIEEIQTSRGIYSKLSIDGKVLGWINKAGLNILYDEELSSSKVAYRAEISNVVDSFYSNPYGTKSNYLTTNAINYVGKLLTVRAEQTTTRDTYSQVFLGNRELGWISKGSLNGLYDTIIRNPIVAYRAKISDDTQNFYSRPAWTEGNQLVNLSSDYSGHTLIVKEEIYTSRGTYSNVFLGNVELGWINKSGLDGLYDEVLRNPLVAYQAKVGDISQNFYSRPAWTANNHLTTNSVNYEGELLTVKEEMYTTGGTYAKVFLGVKELGWINKAGLVDLYDSVLERKIVSYNAVISDTSQNFYNTPAWTEGNFLTTNSSTHTGKTLVVQEEIRTSRGTYAKVLWNGQVLGWINKLGLKDNIVIYLDAGHGGNPSKGGNPGAVYNGVKEQDLNLNISLKVRSRLENLGYTVVMSREDDNHSYADHWRDDLYARPAHANQIGADILVSVHHNASGVWDSSQNGIETYIYGFSSSYPPLPENEKYHNDPVRINESRKLAESIHKDLVANTGANDRGVKPGAFIAVREAKMPAVLLELGFMSNRTELNQLTNSSYQNKLVDGIVSGIHNYFLI